MKKFWREGEPFVWASGAALSLTLLIAATLIVVVMVNGLGVFWPADVTLARLHDGGRILGEVMQREPLPSGEGERLQFKTGNRDMYGLDFRWVDEAAIEAFEKPALAVVLEREEHGNFYGLLRSVEAPGRENRNGDPWQGLEQAMAVVRSKHAVVEEYNARVAELSRRMERLRLDMMELNYQGLAPDSPRMLELKRQRGIVREDFDQLVSLQDGVVRDLSRYAATFADAAGTEKVIPLTHIVRFYRPNQMAWLEKSSFYLSKLKELIVGEPRESNTEGGLFPAIFGTVMLIFLMSLFTFPLGVLAAIYLREYAKEGPVVRLVRIAVNNLAGIPSIVYGIFGLGFFVYGIGSTIDQLFFPERLPNPTFGTGGILWASLTLALLTVPVVIVSTEEALGAIPAGVREGSLALGATKFQTLCRTLLPMASPGIMTGLILAMARAARSPP